MVAPSSSGAHATAAGAQPSPTACATDMPATPSPTTATTTTATTTTATPTTATSTLHGAQVGFPPPGCVVSGEDARDKVLMGICAALAFVENRALTPRQIVQVLHQTGITRLGGNTPASTVSTHIRAHLARAHISREMPLLLRHSLLARPRPSDPPALEDRAVGPSPDGTAERKKGTAWYLSEAAGFASPWDRLGIPAPSEASPDRPPSPSPLDPPRASSRKRTRTKSWSAAARELGMDGMPPPPDFDDEPQPRSKVRIRLRFGSVSSPDPRPLAHALDPDSDVEDGDFHVRMMCNSDQLPHAPQPVVGIGLDLIFDKASDESDSAPSLSSRASSLAASSLPEDDVWAVKIEEVDDKAPMAIDIPPFDPPGCPVGLGFDLGSPSHAFEAEFAMLGVHSPTILPNLFIRDPDHVDGPETVRLDEVDRLWSDSTDKRAHTRTPRARASPSKRRDSACAWGCRAAPGMRVSLGPARTRVANEPAMSSGVVLHRDTQLKIERALLYGVEYATCIVRGCVLLRRLDDSSISLSALLRACRVPGSCHAQFRTPNTTDLSPPPPDTADLSDNSATPRIPSPARTAPEPSDVLHTHHSSSDVNPGAMPQGASIDFGTGVEATDVSGMWAPLPEARLVAEERLRPYLPEDVRLIFLGETLSIQELDPEVKMEPPEANPEPQDKMDVHDEPEMKIEPARDDTPSAPVPAREKGEEDVSVFVRPSSPPAAVPCAARRVLRARPARAVRTRTRA
ncbi:hypothetical protein CTheo_2201 [Ceratobasidium theobromae]|uniref:GDS1 winged helix domain-containing protein n=1 Tax=Ceratobasidium theobromae TaxID=1582974 RepID=A0A5N5QRU6_9AGAM|nr:hypothetical protein CTheo_2201 [Ceratobasidium theobromae]